MFDLLVDILYSLRRWRAFFAWAVPAALIYPLVTYFPDHGSAWYGAIAIGFVGFVGGLYWEAKSGSS
jgi:hypothetical protein